MAGADPAAGCAPALGELARDARTIGIDLSSESLTRFQAYLETLLFWRSRLSLTAATDPLTIVRDHILDSLHVAPLIEPGFRVADVGSGAGFPGVPLAIVRPTSTIVLIESKRKKASFLREVAREVRLTNVEVVEGRGESLDARYAGSFDAVVARAVGSLGDFLIIAQRLLKSAGAAIAMKGPKARQEALGNTPGFSGPDFVEYVLQAGRQRALVVYRKL